MGGGRRKRVLHIQNKDCAALPAYSEPAWEEVATTSHFTYDPTIIESLGRLAGIRAFSRKNIDGSLDGSDQISTHRKFESNTAHQKFANVSTGNFTSWHANHINNHINQTAIYDNQPLLINWQDRT